MSQLWRDGLIVSRRRLVKYDTADDPITVEGLIRDDHLRVVNGSVEDAYIQHLISVSLSTAQRATQRRILPETWRVDISAFPSGHIELPYPPLIEVVGVEYYDGDGTLTTLPVDSYQLDAPYGPEAARATIRLTDGESWPSTFTRRDAVLVTFRCGYVDSLVSPEVVDVPEDLTHARMLLITDLDQDRGSATTGVGVSVTPNTQQAMTIFESYRDRTEAG